MQTAILLATAIFTAVPPLTDKQVMQLQSAIDNSPLVDEAAWYPLLRNALEWQGDVKPGSKIPDYDAIGQTPSAYRGQRFILAGRYAGRPPSRTDLKVTNLARAGPWDGKLEQWSMIVANDPEIVAIVYLVDPPDEPQTNSHIEIVARFYKIWETTNLANQVSRYPVFVGKSAKLFKTAYSTSTDTSRLFLALVIALGLGWLILRLGVMRGGGDPVPSRHHVVPTHEPQPYDHANDDDQDGLPQDPAQALLEIKRRQRKQPMNSIAIDLPHHRYEVLVGSSGLNQLGNLVQEVAPHTRAALLIDEGLPDQHVVSAQSSLQQSGYDLVIEPMPVGENHKNLDTVRTAYERLLSAQFERHSPVIAMGGGIVGDTVGFIAATYLRGVPFIQCPTTLLAMVDASVGGKVGVNLPQGKNLVGSFYQPSLVVIDTDTLSTLPDRQMRCGLAECIKHGIIRDAELFTWTENHVDEILSQDRDILVELVRRNVQIKASVVIADEKELGQRAHLNFGHTFAHAIEAAGKFDSPSSYHHGEAVALGMVAATKLSVTIGRCDPNILQRLTSLLERAGLPTQSPHLPATRQLLELMRVDKKVAGGQLRLVLPTNLGQVDLVNAVDEQHIVDAWDSLRR